VVDAAGEIYGDVANIAARVQALAEPGAVRSIHFSKKDSAPAPADGVRRGARQSEQGTKSNITAVVETGVLSRATP